MGGEHIFIKIMKKIALIVIFLIISNCSTVKNKTDEIVKKENENFIYLFMLKILRKFYVPGPGTVALRA